MTRARILGRTRQWYNYDLPQGLVGTAWHGRYRGQTQLWFAAKLRRRGQRDRLYRPKPGHEQEFDAWQWVPLGELAELVVPFKRQVYEGVIQEFERFVLGLNCS